MCDVALFPTMELNKVTTPTHLSDLDHVELLHVRTCTSKSSCISESVDSLCRDGADAQYMQYFKEKPYNFTTNTLKAYLSTYSSSLSPFMISKTHISAQKPRGRQLNAKVCGCESAIFRLLSFLLRPQSSTTISRERFKYSPSFYHKTDAYHSAELYNPSASS